MTKLHEKITVRDLGSIANAEGEHEKGKERGRRKPPEEFNQKF